MSKVNNSNSKNSSRSKKSTPTSKSSNNKKATSKKGFTLIELLAVIVIMGVLMITAIPAITQAIARSRRDTFATNAKKLIDAVRNGIADDEFLNSDQKSNCQLPGQDEYLVINLVDTTSGKSAVEHLLERGANKSSFGQAYSKGYVLVTNSGQEVPDPEADAAGSTKTIDHYEYYIFLVDKGKNGTKDYVKESELQRNKISVAGATTTTPTIPTPDGGAALKKAAINDCVYVG